MLTSLNFSPAKEFHFPDREGMELFFNKHCKEIDKSVVKFVVFVFASRDFSIYPIKTAVLAVAKYKKIKYTSDESKRLLEGLVKCTKWHEFHKSAAEKEMDRLQIEYRKLSSKST